MFAIRIAFVIMLAAAIAFGVPLALLAAAPNPARAPAQAVVAVETAGGERYCSAVVIAPGAALTAKHCDAERAYLVRGDERVAVTAWRPDPARDIARLEAPGLTCPCVPTGGMDLAESGTPVFALGYPRGGLLGIVYGVALGRLMVDRDAGADPGLYLAFTGKIEPGMSGGGLFVVRDSVAVLVGVLSWVVTEGAVSGAVPVEE